MWTESTGYTGTTGGGKTFGIYDSESPSPMEMVLHGHAACSLIDVIDGLKHRKKTSSSSRLKSKQIEQMSHLGYSHP